MEERIGEYLVRRLVGEGGMGKVYEAEERLTKRRVALKVLRPELCRHDDARRLFVNEMRILAHLEHANVVRSLACVEHDGQLVMALEFIDGKTLRDRVSERGRLPWGEAVDIAIQIAQALAAAHAQTPPIVHRDLKPENVMLTASGAVKVMDFGIAKVLEAAHATNTHSIGTLQYMSPEQIDARPIDARSDLYSLGLVLYEMLSGAPPFRSASARELLNLQCTADPPDVDEELRATIPAGVEAVMLELLAKSPDERPASAADVAARLLAFKPAARDARPSATTARATAAKTERTPSPSADRASTLQPSSKRPLDTVALVERATEPRRVPNAVAVAVIAAISLAVGGIVYTARVHAAATANGGGAVATAKP